MKPSEDQQSQEDQQGRPVRDPKIVEFNQACALHRFEATLMFGELTVYITVVGAAFRHLLQQPSPPIRDVILISFCGLLITASFTLISYRASQHLLTAVKRAEQLEAELDFHLYRSRPTRKTIFNGINAARSIYIIGAASFVYFLSQSLFA